MSTEDCFRPDGRQCTVLRTAFRPLWATSSPAVFLLLLLHLRRRRPDAGDDLADDLAGVLRVRVVVEPRDDGRALRPTLALRLDADLCGTRQSL